VHQFRSLLFRQLQDLLLELLHCPARHTGTHIRLSRPKLAPRVVPLATYQLVAAARVASLLRRRG
jgi:DNA-binding TFAR19-related protein (PDSD5 family)